MDLSVADDNRNTIPKILDCREDPTHSKRCLPGRPTNIPIPPKVVCSSLGALEVFPNELLFFIISELDAQSISRFSRVYYRAKEIPGSRWVVYLAYRISRRDGRVRRM